MRARDTTEDHRVATPLELFFDLCFVVAVAQASAGLHHGLAEGQLRDGVTSYLLVFFAIWWAWMNFSWFASAYDVDDVLYRLATLVQITGVLILAAGIPRAFESSDFDVMFVGYLVMRSGLVFQWLRAAHDNPSTRTTAHRFAAGVTLCMGGWAIVLALGWPLWAFCVAAVCEMAVPVWAEAAEHTPWHPHHIAERYGLFTLIVLGESVLAASIAFQAALDEGGASATLIVNAVGGLLIVFSMWWLYFAKPAAPFLVSNRIGFVWGYGHYFVFASAAAVGAALALNVDHVLHRDHVSDTTAGLALSVPVAVFLVVLWALMVRPHHVTMLQTLLYPAAALLVLLLGLTGQPVLLVGLVLAALVAASIVMSARALARR